MANYFTNDTDLTAVADAIRAKGGTSSPLEYPDEFVSAIEDISTVNNQNKTRSYTPTETAQSETVTADSGYTGLGQVSVSVGAIDSNYVGSGITRRSSSDMTASGATVTAPAGYYSSSASKSVTSGTAGTPTASKGTVSNHSVSVTPSVTNTTGYITGETKTGTAVTVTASELVSGTVNISSAGNTNVTNYATASVASGSATTPTTSITANPTLFVSNTGLVSAAVSKSQNITPTVNAGWVSSGTAGSVSIDGLATQQLSTQAATTFHPSTTDQTIASGKYTTGTQTFKAVTTTNLSAENIVSGVTVKVGDSTDDDCVASVTGTAQGGTLSGLVWQDNEGYIHFDDEGGDMYITTPLNVTTNGTYTAPTGVAYTPVSVQVSSSPTLQAKTNISPTTSSQTITPDSGYDGLSSVQINAMPSGSATPAATITGTDATISTSSVSGDSFLTLSKSVNNTPQVTAGYVASGTAGNSSVSLTAPINIDEGSTYAAALTDKVVVSSGTYATGDVKVRGIQITNLAAGNIKDGVTVTVGDSVNPSRLASVTGTYEGSGGATYTATITGTPSETSAFVRYNNTYYYTVGDEITFSAGDTMTLSAMGVRYGGDVSIDGTVVVSDPDNGVSYNYTLPSHDIIIDCVSGSTAHLYVTFPTIPITQNGKTNVNGYYYADVNVSGGGGAGQKQINFIDYDGTIVESYTASEWANVSALPSNPSHTGLVAQGWNWTKAQIDAQLTALPDGDVWVGQMYTTQSGNTEMDIALTYAPLQVNLRLAVKGTVTVNWGDGNTSTVTGTSLTTALSSLHTYNSAGNYTIQISNGGSSTNKYTFFGDANTATTSVLSGNMMESLSFLVTNLRLGAGIESIGGYAFKLCYNLMSVTMTSAVSSINGNAFNDCKSIKCLVIPNAVTAINRYTGNGNQNLSRISIPYGITAIGNYAFYRSGAASITIPITVNSISSYAFNDTAIRSIAVPSNAVLSDHAFYSCRYLNKINAFKTATGATYLLSECPSLESVTFDSDITEVYNYMFYNSLSLKSVTLNNNITSIGTNAFYGCYALSTINLPSTLTSIAASSFYNCKSLLTITIPASVTTIGNNAFYNCLQMREMHFLSTTPPTASSNALASNAKLYVPYSADHSVLEAYKTAWSYYESRLYEESP